MPLPSGSELERIMTCLGPAVLEQTGSTGEPAIVGTIKHGFLEDAANLGRDAALARVDDARLRAVCAAIDLERLPVDPTKYAAEVAFAWDAVSGVGRPLGTGLTRQERDALVRSTEYRLTIDIVALLGEDSVYVGDWKTGQGHVPAAKVNWQLRLGALAVARAYGRTRARVEIIRLKEDGDAYRDTAELGAFDLADIELELQARAQLIFAAREAFALSGSTPPLVLGPQCRHCPSISACPPHRDMIVALIVRPEQTVATIAAKLTPEHELEAYEQVAALRAHLEQLEGRLESYAAGNPIRLRDGRVYGAVQVSRESLDGNKLWDLLEQTHGRETAREAVELRATKAQLERVLTPIAKQTGLKKTHLVRDTLDRLRAVGGVYTKYDESVRIHKPPKEAP